MICSGSDEVDQCAEKTLKDDPVFSRFVPASLSFVVILLPVVRSLFACCVALNVEP